ncbi:hypothetical protein vseg_002988 [Gypsophila vaccaria]
MGKIVAAFFICLIFLLGLSNYYVVNGYGERCCQDHLELGNCVPGIDDNPKTGGYCWNYCIAECTLGGVCKPLLGGNLCRCLC